MTGLQFKARQVVCHATKHRHSLTLNPGSQAVPAPEKRRAHETQDHRILNQRLPGTWHQQASQSSQLETIRLKEAAHGK